MNLLHTALSNLRVAKTRAGFTMIELLIVISILGILAVAVLSAINPVEQINRGRDTGTRSDAEQLISANDRFQAFQGFYPWQTDANDEANLGIEMGRVTATYPTGTTANSEECTTLARLSEGDEANNTECIGSQELKSSFVSRITTSPSARAMFIYNRGQAGDATYVCFVPQSRAFRQEAQLRCTTAGAIPADLLPMQDVICDTNDGSARVAGVNGVDAMSAFAGQGEAICLP